MQRIRKIQPVPRSPELVPRRRPRGIRREIVRRVHEQERLVEPLRRGPRLHRSVEVRARRRGRIDQTSPRRGCAADRMPEVSDRASIPARRQPRFQRPRLGAAQRLDRRPLIHRELVDQRVEAHRIERRRRGPGNDTRGEHRHAGRVRVGDAEHDVAAPGDGLEPRRIYGRLHRVPVREDEQRERVAAQDLRAFERLTVADRVEGAGRQAFLDRVEVGLLRPAIAGGDGEIAASPGRVIGRDQDLAAVVGLVRRVLFTRDIGVRERNGAHEGLGSRRRRLGTRGGVVAPREGAGDGGQGEDEHSGDGASRKRQHVDLAWAA